MSYQMLKAFTINIPAETRYNIPLKKRREAEFPESAMNLSMEAATPIIIAMKNIISPPFLMSDFFDFQSISAKLSNR